MNITFAIITASSTRDIEHDTAGAALKSLIEENEGWSVISHIVVDDDRALLSQAIVDACDAGANIVLTCGGTGLSLRDVTPEATKDVCDRDVPGVAEAIRATSMQKTRRAMLSRALCMQRGATLVINMPGSEKAARECWDAVSDQLDHAMKMTAGEGH